MSDDKKKPNPHWVKFQFTGVCDEATIRMLEGHYPKERYDFNKHGPDGNGLFVFTIREK